MWLNRKIKSMKHSFSSTKEERYKKLNRLQKGPVKSWLWIKNKRLYQFRLEWSSLFWNLLKQVQSLTYWINQTWSQSNRQKILMFKLKIILQLLVNRCFYQEKTTKVRLIWTIWQIRTRSQSSLNWELELVQSQILK